MTVLPIDQNSWRQVARLMLLLWPHHDPEETARECEALAADGEEATAFLAWEGERAVGFAQCGLRRDYVEGSSTSPVGYLEGIFVEEPLRGQGVGRALLRACEGWCRVRGCVEMASDCSPENLQSQRFHLAGGFAEAGRIVCYIKPLEGQP